MNKCSVTLLRGSFEEFTFRIVFFRIRSEGLCEEDFVHEERCGVLLRCMQRVWQSGFVVINTSAASFPPLSRDGGDDID